MKKSQVGRRELMQAGLAGLAAARLGGSTPAQAGAGAGRVVTPNPIPARIQFSGVAVELVEFCAPPPTRNLYPRALLNFMYHAGDGSRRLFANDSRGKLWLIDRATGRATLFLDVANARGAAFFGIGSRQIGLRSFAFHPNSKAPGAARIPPAIHHQHGD